MAELKARPLRAGASKIKHAHVCGWNLYKIEHQPQPETRYARQSAADARATWVIETAMPRAVAGRRLHKIGHRPNEKAHR
jgi:hypothetical protein